MRGETGIFIFFGINGISSSLTSWGKDEQRVRIRSQDYWIEDEV